MGKKKKIKGNAWTLVLMLNQPFLSSLSTFLSLLLTMCREKRGERFPDIHSSDTERGNLKEREQAGCSVEAERLVGGVGVSVSVSEEDLSTCRSPHSCTFQGSHRQSVVRGPGTDLGSVCQQQIFLIEIARDPYSHVHDTRRHKKKHTHGQAQAHTHALAHTPKKKKNYGSFGDLNDNLSLLFLKE